MRGLATVFIRGLEFGYERTGVGRPLIVLVSDQATREELSRSLTPGRRVIVPDFADAGVALETVDRWELLRGLLVGLGMDEVGLVLDDEWSLAGLGLAVTEPDRVDRLAFVVGGPCHPLPGSGLEDHVSGTAQRILVVPAGGRGLTHACVRRLDEFFGSAAP